MRQLQDLHELEVQVKNSRYAVDGKRVTNLLFLLGIHGLVQSTHEREVSNLLRDPSCP